MESCVPLPQGALYIPSWQETETTVDGISFAVREMKSGYIWDFGLSEPEFVDEAVSGQPGTKWQALSEGEDGHWYYTTGWTVPGDADHDSQYQILLKISDSQSFVGTYYREGDLIVIDISACVDRNAKYVDDQSDGKHMIVDDWTGGGIFLDKLLLDKDDSEITDLVAGIQNKEQKTTAT